MSIHAWWKLLELQVVGAAAKLHEKRKDMISFWPKSNKIQFKIHSNAKREPKQAYESSQSCFLIIWSKWLRFCIQDLEFLSLTCWWSLPMFHEACRFLIFSYDSYDTLRKWRKMNPKNNGKLTLIASEKITGTAAIFQNFYSKDCEVRKGSCLFWGLGFCNRVFGNNTPLARCVDDIGICLLTPTTTKTQWVKWVKQTVENNDFRLCAVETSRGARGEPRYVSSAQTGLNEDFSETWDELILFFIFASFVLRGDSHGM